jgi:PKD repeat protein
MIFQPVTAFDYLGHSSLSGTAAKLSDPAIINRWTGSSWFCPPQNDLCIHSPVIGFYEGEAAEGVIVWDNSLQKWRVLLTNAHEGTSTWYYSDVFQNAYLQPFRAVIVYEWHRTTPDRRRPWDEDKISNTHFIDISARDPNNLLISVNWHKIINQNDHRDTGGLDVLFAPSSVSPSQIILCTDCYPLVADFAADTRSGRSPLNIHFTDLSAGHPTGWAWDFNNDGQVDSTAQNPDYSYTYGGSFTVRLTVTRALGESDDEIKTGYIIVNGIAVQPLPGQTNPPTDPDLDGLYEDLNGNGRIDFADLQMYFRNMDWIRENEPVALFDYNNNGRIDFADIQLLFIEI